MIEVGTRTRTTRLNAAAPGQQTRGFSRDVGMSKLTSGSFTFGPGGATGPAGCFAAFAPGDVVLIEGTNLNNGYHAIETISGGDSITADKGFATEGPIVAGVRTS